MREVESEENEELIRVNNQYGFLIQGFKP